MFYLRGVIHVAFLIGFPVIIFFIQVQPFTDVGGNVYQTYSNQDKCCNKIALHLSSTNAVVDEAEFFHFLRREHVTAIDDDRGVQCLTDFFPVGFFKFVPVGQDQ